MSFKLANVPKGFSRTNVQRGKFQIKGRFIRSTRTWPQKAFQAAVMNSHAEKATLYGEFSHMKMKAFFSCHFISK